MGSCASVVGGGEDTVGFSVSLRRLSCEGSSLSCLHPKPFDQAFAVIVPFFFLSSSWLLALSYILIHYFFVVCLPHWDVSFTRAGTLSDLLLLSSLRA